MVRKEILEVRDDLDQTPGASTVSLGLDGRLYEVDLSERNKAKLDKALAKYIAAARKVGARTATRSSASGRRPDLAEVRHWAQAIGYDIGDRGRISAEVLTAYDAAH
jgi:hypothetical protein